MKAYSLSGLFFLAKNVVANFPHQIGDTVFYTDNIKRTWDDCNAMALSYNLTFASVHSQEENDSIDTQYWLGGKRDCDTCPFYWVDGTEWDFENWFRNEPASGMHLAKLRFDGFWRTHDLLFPNGNVRKYTCLFRGEKPWDAGKGRVITSSDDIVIEHAIGPYVTQTVEVALYDFDCATESVENVNNSVALKNIMGDERPITYDIEINTDLLGIDPQNFVNVTANDDTIFKTTEIKFCTRVSTFEGSVDVGFRDTQFILNYDLLVGFNLTSVEIVENSRESFTSVLEDEFLVQSCQCENFECVASPFAITQGDPLVMCVYATSSDPVAITNFNLKMSASSLTDYYEYNPVWFGTGQWQHDALTVVESSDDDKTVMITMEVVAQFFLRGFDAIDMSGNVFLEFVSSKAKTGPMFESFGYTQELIAVETQRSSCLTDLLRNVFNQAF